MGLGFRVWGLGFQLLAFCSQGGHVGLSGVVFTPL